MPVIESLTTVAQTEPPIYAPILTPFKEDGKTIDVESFLVHLLYLRDSGVDGILLLGTNGEFGMLSSAERWLLIEAFSRANTGLKLIVGATEPTSPEGTLRLAEELDNHLPKTATLLVAPPFYDRYANGSTVPDDEVIAFFQHVVELRLERSILGYNLPVSGDGPLSAALTPSIISKISSLTMGGGSLIGVKDSTGVASNILLYQAALPGAVVMMGNDHILGEGIGLGASGSITACANIFPSAVVSVWAAKNADERQAAQGELSRLRVVLESVPGKMIAIQKLLLWRLGIVANHSPVRDVALELSTAEEATVRSALAETLPHLKVNADLSEVLGLTP